VTNAISFSPFPIQPHGLLWRTHSAKDSSFEL
jgi:hypothetical protein